ncbi:MAG TPA: prefoldin subunit alpha [Candidatus Nanoarchaeia archaeon]|nr:prefoldin subunit alpha [Candidatus Nanoarchaeia archaeon]
MKENVKEKKTEHIDQKQFQQKYMEIQICSAQIKEIQKQLQALENQFSEIISIKESLDEMSRISHGTEILVPVSSGIFATAEIKNTSNLLVNVGGGVIVEKNIEQTKQLLDRQLDEIMHIKSQLSSEAGKISQRAQVIEQDLVSLAKS